MSTEAGSPSPDAPRRRRARYGGKHPRRFDQRYKELQPESYPDMQEHIRAQGRTPAGTHVPVLLNEVLEVLSPRPGDIVVDGTLGYGGHARVFLERIGTTGRLIGLDVDGEQLARTASRFAAAHKTEAREVEHGIWKPQPNVTLFAMHFAGAAKALAKEGLTGCDVLFVDLGVSSMQLDDPERGFSYKKDGPLDMRMNLRGRTAAELIAEMPEDEIAAALGELADEPHAVEISRAIVRQRRVRPLVRSQELVRLIFEAKGIDAKAWKVARRAGDASLHPAARTFQALRIMVNDELAGISQLLRVAPWCLKPGGRLGVISFHSGEHELVEQALADGGESGLYDARVEGPIRPSAAEIAANARARSAELRWARRGTW